MKHNVTVTSVIRKAARVLPDWVTGRVREDFCDP